MSTKYFVCSFLLIVLVVCVFSTGCTSTQSTPASAQSNIQTIPTSEQPSIPITTSKTPVTTQESTTAPISISSKTTTPINNGIGITFNSAVKKTKIGPIGIPAAGDIYLILDITLQNNDTNNEFKYSDSSFSILDKKNSISRVAITSKFGTGTYSGITDPLSTGAIPLKSTKTGQIVFPVPDNSSSYKLSVVDSTGTLLASIDNINVA